MFDHDATTQADAGSVARPAWGAPRLRPDDPVATITAAVDSLSHEDRSGWSGPARSAYLQELLAARERLEAEVLRATGEWHAAEGWIEEQSLSPVSWLAEHGSITRREASDLLRTSRLVHTHPRTGEALASGDVPAAGVSVLARAAQHRQPVFDAQEDVLVAAASELAPEELRKLARAWQHMADDVLDRAPADVQKSRWHLQISTTFGGAVALHGLLDPEGGAILLSALQAIDAPDPTDGPREPRSLPERYAEALVLLAQGEGSRRVNVDVVVDLARLQGAATNDLEALRGEILGIGPIGSQALEYLACDCSIGRVVMRGKSVVMDLGRRTRVVSPSQRRALAARDGGCVVPGCGAPVHWCDAHHQQPWTAGGPTDLDHLELRCRRHHLEAHGCRSRPPPLGVAA